MPRKRTDWKVRDRVVTLGDRTLIMAILNVTPDSFSDGGEYLDPDAAYARALQLEEQGADLLDLGAESTRPGSSRVSEQEEWERLEPVLTRLQDKLSIPISVDTYKSGIAQRALDLGAEVINDPTGLTFDPEMARVVNRFNAGLVLNHMRGTPETWAKLPSVPDMMSLVVKELEASVARATRAGIERSRIAVDPGLGFGKRKEQNFELLARLDQLARLDVPILVGPSRKGFLARGTEEETVYATIAAVTAAILGGAGIVRVHDVREASLAAQVADAILIGAMPPPEIDTRTERRAGTAREPKPVFEDPRKATPVRPRLLKDFGPSRREEEPDELPQQREEDRPPRPPADRREERPRERERAAQPARRFEPRDDRPPRRFDDRDQPRPSAERPRRFDDRPSYGAQDRPPRRFDDRGGDGPPRRFNDRGGDGPPRRFEDRGGDRPPRRFDDRGGDRPPQRYPDRGGDRPPQRFDDRGGDRPPKRFDDRGGDRPPRRYDDRQPPERRFDNRGGDSPRGSFGDRREGGPPRKFSGGGKFGPPKGGKKPFGPPKGGKPFRPKRGS